jgi:hypothetical protein
MEVLNSSSFNSLAAIVPHRSENTSSRLSFLEGPMSSSHQEVPSFKSIAPRFQCRHLKETFAFYTKLGFTTDWEDEGFAIVKRNGIAIHFNLSTDDECSSSVCWI